MLNSTWFEDFASDGNIIQEQEDIMSARVTASNIRVEIYVVLRWLFDHISGLTSSFGFSPFVNLDMARRICFRG